MSTRTAAHSSFASTARSATHPPAAGGTPTPGGEAPNGELQALNDHVHHYGDTTAQLQLMGLIQQRDAYRDLIAQVMEALGVDRPEDVVDAIRAMVQMVTVREEQRDEARDEVERLQAERDAWIEQARQVGVKLEQFKAAAPQHPDPLMLALPEVPDGTVALVGRTTRVRYVRETTSPVTWRIPGHRDALTLLEVFQDSGPELEVELAPPREPRTWSRRPLVEDPPDDLRMVKAGGGTGEVYRRDANNPDRWVSERGVTERWELLREVDLTEVFDEPGGEQR